MNPPIQSGHDSSCPRTSFFPPVPLGKQLILVFVWILLAGILMPSNAIQAATLNAGFSEAQIATGIAAPTTMQFAPDGRLFVSQQAGTLRVIKSGVLLATPAITLTVDNRGERGLLGIAFDPNFAVNQYIYLYYTATTPAAHNRVSRFTLSGDVIVAGSELVILDLPDLSAAQNHNGGTILFGPDEKLYVAVGENANTANAQSMTTPLGKMLRINSDGSIPTDNPFYATTTGINRSIWALGLRNPYSFTFQPGSGRMFINDVGQSTWEEINDGVAGANYGWPSCEGTCGSGFVNPVYSYGHGSSSTTGIAITGGAFYNPATGQFPASFLGDYFFVDYTGWINVLDIQTGQVSVFCTSMGSTVDLKVGPDGRVYYLNRTSGSVYAIKSDGGQVPTVTQQPANVVAHAGESATFTVAASGTQPMTYQWQRNGVNIAGATSSSYTLTGVTAADNNAAFRCIINNSFGTATSSAATLIFSSNNLPVVTILSPTANSLYAGLDTISYSASATDVEDGTLGSSAFSWTIMFHHDTHTHPFLGPINGVTSGTFQIPNVGETSDNVWYRVYVTVTDSAGEQKTSFVDIRPRKVTLTLNTIPSGLQLLMDGQPVVTPYSVLGVAGIKRTVGIVTPQPLGGFSYDFSSWSDSGAASHDIVTPASSASYTATFTQNTNVAIASYTFANSTSLTIPSSGVASVYPSKVTVSGITGNATKISVQLNGFSHTYPDDVDMLLVGPGGQSVVLISDAGGGNDAVGINLTFDDTSSSVLGDETQLASGTFRTANFEGADTYVTPAPTTTPAAGLGVFSGTNPNGTWSLYVMDGSGGDGGSISGGWSVIVGTLSAAPTISDIAGQVIQEDQSMAPVAFTIGDADTSVSSLVVSASSSNPAIVPNGNITLGGSGTARTVAVTPLANSYGTVTITVSVSDGASTASDSFALSILPINDAPIISSIADQVVQKGSSTGPIAFTIGDLETSPDALEVTAISSDTTLVPNNNISLSGTGSARALQVNPVSNLSGSTTITVTVTDETGASTAISFNLVIQAGAASTITFANNNPITINPSGVSTPNPSTVTVSGGPGSITRVKLTLNGFSHTYPDDVDMLLVGPGGQKILVMSDAGGASDATGLTLTFSDDASQSLPDETPILASGNYKPSNFGSGDVIMNPAPAGPYDSTFGSLTGTNPNGVWSLYVNDDSGGDGGSISGGWSLTFDTPNTLPTLTAIADQTLSEGGSVNNLTVTVGDLETPAAQLLLTAATSNSDLLPLTGIGIGGTDATRTVSITPEKGKSGTATVTLSVTDGVGASASSSFLVTVQAATGTQFVTNTFSSTAGITVPDIGNAGVFPSTIAVTGTTLSLSKLRVTLNGINHTYPDDFDIVLEAPSGQKIVLLSDVGGGTDWVNLNLTLDDDAAGGLPDNSAAFSGSYKPTDFVSGDAFSPLIPAGVFVSTLSGFNGINPNGTWSLYLMDDEAQDIGSLSGGWSITVIGAAPQTPPNTLPTISTIANQATSVGTQVANIPFTIQDAESVATALVLSAQSDNLTVLPQAGIALGGSGGNRTITLTPASGQSGVATVTVTVTDPQGGSKSTAFTLTVQPGSVTTTFANATGITLPNSGIAATYPASISVSGTTGAILKVKATLDGLNHTYPDDLDILLVSPTGQKVILMSDAGGAADALNLTLTFDDDAVGLTGDDVALASGTFKPSNYGAGDVFYAPAPAAPYATSLSTFAGSSANGTWSLYILDDSGGDAGSLTRGWSLTITTTGTVTVAEGAGSPQVTGPTLETTPITPSVWISGIESVGTLQVRLQIGGQPFKRYLLESSTNLTDWTFIQSGEVDQDQISFEQEIEPGASRFFRVRYEE